MHSGDKVRICCLGCGATNNFPVGAVGKTVVCGRCKTPLPLPGRVLEPTANQLETLIQNASLPLLIDFYSMNCAPCHVMTPVVEALAQRRAGEVMVLKVETDENPVISVAFHIQAVPTFAIFRKGMEVGRTTGAMNETDFSLWVASKA